MFYTFYTPPEREELGTVRRVSKIIPGIMKSVLGLLPGSALVINDERQILFVNQAFLDFLSTTNAEKLIGQRPGEAINCPWAFSTSEGCGASEKCFFCGINKVLKNTFESGQPNTGEAFVSINFGEICESLYFKVTCSPFYIQRTVLYLILLEDMFLQKQKELLENTFFNGVLNNSNSILGLAKMAAREEVPHKKDVLVNILVRQCDALNDEIQAQRDLVSAELGTLKPSLETVACNMFVTEVVEAARGLESSAGRIIEIAQTSPSAFVEADKRLLKRVMLSIVKNAVEASMAGESVKIGCEAKEGLVTFWVQNRAVMSGEVRRYVFARHFSTKGDGRGIGTYNAKLLTEKCMGGKMEFVSNKDVGTVFLVTLPEAASVG